MDNTVESTAEKIQKSLVNGFKLGIANGNAEIYQNANTVNQFKNVMEKLSQLEYDFSNEHVLIEGIQSETIEEFEKESKRLMKEAEETRPNPKDSQRYNKFAKDLEDLQFVAREIEAPTASTNDIALGDGLTVQNDDFQVKIDPISKNPIRDPVLNIHCKHIYDKDTILEAIRLNSRLRCPYVGCQNRKLTAADLQPDRELKRKIMQIQSQRDQDETMDSE